MCTLLPPMLIRTVVPNSISDCNEIFCRLKALTTSSSMSAMLGSLPTFTEPLSACRWWPMPDRRRANAIAPLMSCSRARFVLC